MNPIICSFLTATIHRKRPPLGIELGQGHSANAHLRPLLANSGPPPKLFASPGCKLPGVQYSSSGGDTVCALLGQAGHCAARPACQSALRPPRPPPSPCSPFCPSSATDLPDRSPYLPTGILPAGCTRPVCSCTRLACARNSHVSCYPCPVLGLHPSRPRLHRPPACRSTCSGRGCTHRRRRPASPLPDHERRGMAAVPGPHWPLHCAGGRD